AVHALGAGAVRASAARVAGEARRAQVAGHQLVARVLAALARATSCESDAERRETRHPPALHLISPLVPSAPGRDDGHGPFSVDPSLLTRCIHTCAHRVRLSARA